MKINSKQIEDWYKNFAKFYTEDVSDELAKEMLCDLQLQGKKYLRTIFFTGAQCFRNFVLTELEGK